MKLYPVGFEDETYIKAERGVPGTKGAEKLKEAALELSDIVEGSAADRAGLQAGDRLLDELEPRRSASRRSANRRQDGDGGHARGFRGRDVEELVDFLAKVFGDGIVSVAADRLLFRRLQRCNPLSESVEVRIRIEVVAIVHACGEVDIGKIHAVSGQPSPQECGVGVGEQRGHDVDGR